MWRIRIWFSYPNYSRRWERVSYIGEERCVTTLKWLRRWLRWVISFSFFFPSRLLVRCNAFLSIFAGVWIKGHSPFVRTGRRDLSSRRENWTIEPDYQPDQLIPKWFAWQWFFFFSFSATGLAGQFWLLESTLRPRQNIELLMRRTKVCSVRRRRT